MTLHDIHIHTFLSPCAKNLRSDADEYIRICQKNGMEYIGFSDHFWDEKITECAPCEKYKNQNFSRISSLFDYITEKSGDMKVLFGCEAEFCKAKILGITEERIKQFDYVLVPHSHTNLHGFTIEREVANNFRAHAGFLVDSFNALCKHNLSKYITAVAHPFYPLGADLEAEIEILSFIDDNTFGECFTNLKNSGIAFEINFSVIKRLSIDDTFRMYAMAKECECKFTLGSDSHSYDGMNPEVLDKARSFINRLGISEYDLKKIEPKLSSFN